MFQLLDFTAGMEVVVVVTTGAIRRAKLQSNRHHQQTPSYFTGWMACLSPNKQCQALKENFTIKVPYIQMWTTNSSFIIIRSLSAT